MPRNLVRTLLYLGILLPRPAIAQTCAVPDVLVVLDASGSMQTVDAGGRRRWDAAAEALSAVTDTWADAVRWGLVVFPAGDKVCGLSGALAPVPSTAAELQAALAGLAPGGLTPTAPALSLARDQLASVRRAGHPQSVVLITDGQPNCNPGLDGKRCTCTCPKDASCSCATDPRACLDDARTLTAVDGLVTDGIKVFVIGLGGDVEGTLLDAMATHGGTARNVPAGAPLYYPAGDASSLSASLRQVASGFGIVSQPCGGAPCGGVSYCTETGFGDCQPFAVGDDLPCDSVQGACGAHQLCSESGLSACAPVNAGDTRACGTRCGTSVQDCQADGSWSTCQGISPGDTRGCAPPFPTCDPAGVQTCGEQGWGSCRASHAGDVRTCTTLCGTGKETCGSSGAWGACAGAAPGDVRACSAPGCMTPGYQVCGASGLGDCLCDVAPAKKHCGCSSGEASPLAFATLAGLRRRRRVVATVPLC